MLEEDEEDEETSVPAGLTQTFVTVDTRNRLSVLTAAVRARCLFSL
jgi:hypothetical protein